MALQRKMLRQQHSILMLVLTYGVRQPSYLQALGSHVVMVTSLLHHVGSHLTSAAVCLLPWRLNLGSIHGNTPHLL